MAETENRPAATLTVALDPQNSDGLYRHIVEEAARQLLNASSYDEDGNEHRYRNELAQTLTREVKDIVREFAQQQAEPILRDVLAKPIPKTDRYGDPMQGAATQTVAEAIGEELKAHLAVRSRDSYSNRSESVLSKVIREEVEQAIRKELAEELKAAKAKVRAALQKQVAEQLADGAARAVGLR